MKIKILVTLAVATLFFFPACKKDTKSKPTESNPLKIIQNQTLANNPNALQAYYSKDGDTTQAFFYGNFDSNGNPLNVKSIIFQTTSGNSISVFFDDQERVTSYYISKLGVKLNFLFAFEYPNQTNVIGKLYSYDFATDSSKLLSQKTFSTTTGQAINSIFKNSNHQYAAFTGSILALLPPNQRILPSKSTIGAIALSAGAALIIFVGAPYLVGSIVVVETGSAIAGSIAGVVTFLGEFTFFLKDAKATEINQPSIKVPPIQNGPFNRNLNNTLWEGTLVTDASPTINNPVYCYFYIDDKNNISENYGPSSPDGYFKMNLFNGTIDSNESSIVWNSPIQGNESYYYFTFDAPWTIKGKTMIGNANFWFIHDNGNAPADTTLSDVYHYKLTMQ